jgi:hypothetical protein
LGCRAPAFIAARPSGDDDARAGLRPTAAAIARALAIESFENNALDLRRMDRHFANAVLSDATGEHVYMPGRLFY